MGLRFRKSIKICKGVRVNFGKTGASLSVGTKGFHKTFHTSGKVTTSVGIPGTGIYWTDTKNPNTTRTHNQPTRTTTEPVNRDRHVPVSVDRPVETTRPTVKEPVIQVPEYDDHMYLNWDDIKEIYTKSDYPVDWTDIAISTSPEDLEMARSTWSYCKEVVEKVLDGDIDTYLDIIDYLRPVDDLIAYAGDFEFGTDKANTMSVEYTSHTEGILRNGVNDPLYTEFVNAVSIRVARDLIALLPISRVNVFVVDQNGNTVSEVTFTKKYLRRVNYNAESATEIVEDQRRENSL